MRTTLVAIFACLALAACPSPASEDTGPRPTPAPTTTPGPTEPPPADAAPAVPLPPQGAPCTPDGQCSEGLTCLKYYGIAGAQGPAFTSCEIPCLNDPSVCPDGQRCIVIADGPGQVCRPGDRAEPGPAPTPSK